MFLMFVSCHYEESNQDMSAWCDYNRLFSLTMTQLKKKNINLFCKWMLKNGSSEKDEIYSFHFVILLVLNSSLFLQTLVSCCELTARYQSEILLK